MAHAAFQFINSVLIEGISNWILHVPFAKLYFISFLQMQELPSHKGIVVSVGISGDESSPPVNLSMCIEQYSPPSSEYMIMHISVEFALEV